MIGAIKACWISHMTAAGAGAAGVVQDLSGQRAYRYIYLDAGHVAENLALAAVSLGLGTCQMGALFDDEVNRLLGVDGAEESVLYMSAAGLPA